MRANRYRLEKSSDASISTYPGSGAEAGTQERIVMAKKKKQTDISDRILQEIARKDYRPQRTGGLARSMGVPDHDYAAVRAGKPTLLVESGQRGNRDEESIANIVNGIWNVIHDLKMIEGTVQKIQNHVEILQYKYVESKVDGIFYPLVGSGENVNGGEQIGYTTDFFGNRISDINAPISGFIMHMIETPPVRKGDPLFCIGSTQQQK